MINRKNLIAPAMAAAAFAIVGSGAQAQANFDTVEIVTTDVGGGIYMLRPMDGNAEVGGNMIAAVGEDGILMIDSNFEPMYAKTKAALSAMSDLPVRYLVNTHHHRDHTGGNVHFGMDGTTIVSHETMREVLAAGSVNGLTGNVLPPAPGPAIPTVTFSDKMTLELQGLTAHLSHPLDPHTNGDAYIFFPDANVFVTGDIVTFGRYPNIDFAYGGHIDRLIAAVDSSLEMIDEDTKVIPGHGPVGDKTTLTEYRQMLATSRERVRALMAEGKTMEEAVALKPNADFDAQLNMSDERIGNWVRVIYLSYEPNG